MNKFQWLLLMSRLSLDDNLAIYNQLLAHYNHKHRHYHNVNHISAVLHHLEQAKHLATDYNAIEVALWFHDAIYKVFSSKNELESAEWASSFLLENGVDGDFVSKVHALVMATMHNAVPVDTDEQLIVDIDLSILGSPAHVYDLFETQIRKEYRLIPKFIYKKKRKEVLLSFLERERIYLHEYFHEKLEKNARTNIENTIRNL